MQFNVYSFNVARIPPNMAIRFFDRGVRFVSRERGLHAEGVAVLLWLRLLHPDHPVRRGRMLTL